MAYNNRLYGRNPFLNMYSAPKNQSALPYGFFAGGQTGPTGGASQTPPAPQSGATSPVTTVNAPNWAQRTFGGMRDWAQNNRGSMSMLLGQLGKAVAGRSTYDSSLYGPVQERPTGAGMVTDLAMAAGANRAASDYMQSGEDRHLAFLPPQQAQAMRQQRFEQGAVTEELGQRAAEGESRHWKRMADIEQKQIDRQDKWMMEGYKFENERLLREDAYYYSESLAKEASERGNAKMFVQENLRTLRMREMQGYTTGRQSRSLALQVARLNMDLDKRDYRKDTDREKTITEINEAISEDITDAEYYMASNPDDFDTVEKRNEFLGPIINENNATWARDRIRLEQAGVSGAIPTLMLQDGKVVRTQGRDRPADMSSVQPPPQVTRDDTAALGEALGAPVVSGPQGTLADEARATAQASGYQPQDGQKYFGNDGSYVVWSDAVNDFVEP